METQKEKKKPSEIDCSRVKKRLTELKMSQEEFAELIDSEPGHVSNILKNKKKRLSLATALKIASVLNMPVEELFEIQN